MRRFHVSFRYVLLSAGLALIGGALSCGSNDSGGETVAVGRPCASNADCPGGGPFCAAGLCVECLSNTACDGARVCDGVAGKCLDPCVAQADCDGDTLCALPRQVCVACLVDGDCADAKKPFCVAELDDCAQCRSSADCGGRTCERGKCKECGSNVQCPSDKPICDIEASECRECLLDAHCPSGAICDGHECREDCRASLAVCGDKVCDPSTGSCVGCLLDADCPSDKPGCLAQECRDCSRDEHCPAGRTCDANKGKCE